jgi:hypothetical protein
VEGDRDDLAAAWFGPSMGACSAYLQFHARALHDDRAS